MKDYIERENAIKAIKQVCNDNRCLSFIERINNVPSADVVEREVYLKAYDKGYDLGYKVAKAKALLDQAYEKQFTNVVERKYGTYTDTKDNYEWYAVMHTCDNCKQPWMGNTNFCPNCGCFYGERKYEVNNGNNKENGNSNQ